MRFKALSISITHALRLYELGVRLDSVLYYFQEVAESSPVLFGEVKNQDSMLWRLHVGKASHENPNIFKEVAAYCTNELGEMLPGFIKIQECTYFLNFKKVSVKTGWQYYYSDYQDNILITAKSETEQDARAKLLIACIEAGYITIEDTIIK
jgi:hypothetical protein